MGNKYVYNGRVYTGLGAIIGRSALSLPILLMCILATALPP